MTNDARFESPFFRRLGYVVWAAMLVLALFFYKERAFFMDAGFQLFNLINEETIQVYHYRFVTGVPQLLPFVLLKMSAPLWLLAASFSASYILFYALVYHLLVRWLKNDYLGWVLIFLFTLISLDTFYHIQSEFYLGLSLLLLTFGLVWRYPAMREKWLFPVLLPLLVTVGFSHKLFLIYFLFFWIFFWFDKPGTPAPALRRFFVADVGHCGGEVHLVHQLVRGGEAGGFQELLGAVFSPFRYPAFQCHFF